MFILFDELRPNNWFLSQEKVERARQAEGPFQPVQVARIDGEWALLDGHSRAYVAWERGEPGIEAVEVQADHPLYALIHREQRVHHISELRILPAEEYKTQWLELCYMLSQPGNWTLEERGHYDINN